MVCFWCESEYDVLGTLGGPLRKTLYNIHTDIHVVCLWYESEWVVLCGPFAQNISDNIHTDMILFVCGNPNMFWWSY